MQPGQWLTSTCCSLLPACIMATAMPFRPPSAILALVGIPPLISAAPPLLLTGGADALPSLEPDPEGDVQISQTLPWGC